jgi:MFS transporter, OFA family, oxalate/formate antiporter
MNLALGSLYAWSVFVPPLEAEFGWSRGDTSWVYTIAVVCFALTFVIAGRTQDRMGPRICAFLGGLLVSAGFFIASFTSSLLAFYVFFGVIVGIGNGFGYAAPIPVGSKWFPDKRGLVVGILVGGYGAGQAIFGTVSRYWLIPSLGWRTSFQVLAVTFFVMTMIGTALLRNPPPGYSTTATARRTVVGAADFTTREMLATPTFYFLWIAFCLGTTAGQMTISQLVPFATSAGLGATVATLSLVVSSIGNAGGRIVSGAVSDVLGRLPTLKVMGLLSAVAMPLLFLFRSDIVLFYALVAVVYWCYGTQLSLFATTTADFYGTRNLGLNYGLMFTAWGAAGIVGPLLAGRTFDQFGDYRYAFFAAGLFAVVAVLSLSVAKHPAHSAAVGQA